MTLEKWLEIATKNLAPRAAVKVREEITAHVESSAEHHALNGVGELEARALARQELGDAAASAKGFERIYLTREELKAARLSKLSASRVGFPALIYTFAILSYFAFPPENLKQMETMVFRISLAVYYGGRWITAKGLSLRNYLISQLVIQPVALILCAFSCLYMSPLNGQTSPVWLSLCIILFTFWGFELIINLIKWHKLKTL